MVYVAVDIGKRRCVACVMGQDGSILDTGSYPNTFFDASHYAKQMVERYPVSPETDSMSSRFSSRAPSRVVSPTVPVVTSMPGTAL